MPFKKILLPLDGSPVAEEAIAHALLIARSCVAEIHLLHVQRSRSHSDENSIDPVDWRLRRAEARRYLDRLAERISVHDIPVTLNILEGRPAEQIVEYAEEKGIDLIVLTAYGKGGVSRFHFGSTAQKVISGSGISFILVRPSAAPLAPEELAYRRILIAMDGSHRSEWMACQVAAMMRGQKAELILLQVIAVPEMPRRMPITREEQATREKFVECNRRAAQVYLDEIARQLQNGIRVRARLIVAQSVVGSIYTAATEEEADMIAVSAHDSQTEVHRVTGTVCQTLINQCSRPVLMFQDLPNTRPQRLQMNNGAGQIPQLMYPHDTNDR